MLESGVWVEVMVEAGVWERVEFGEVIFEAMVWERVECWLWSWWRPGCGRVW